MTYCVWSVRIYDLEFSYLKRHVKPSDINYIGLTIGRLNICRNPHVKEGLVKKKFKIMK